jgi:hypothetical protein
MTKAMITIDQETLRRPVQLVSFGALTIPYPAGSALSVVVHDGHADTIAIRTSTGQIALNLYAATSSGHVPGYLGSCLRYLSSENIDTSALESFAGDELGGTAADGMHYRFLSTSGEGWLLRGSVRSPRACAPADIALTRSVLHGAIVVAPRHHMAGTTLELDTEPRWISRSE